MLNYALKEPNKEHFHHISSWARHANKELKGLQVLCHDQQLGDGRLQQEAVVLPKKAYSLGEAEKIFYQQKAKNHFIKRGDKCTKFFYDLVKRNAKRNQLIVVWKADETLTSSQQGLPDEFVTCYSMLLVTHEASSPIDPSVDAAGSRLT